MRIELKMVDIEVMIDDEKETDRSKLAGDALGCIESMVQYRLSLEGSILAQAERAEDSEGSRPEQTDQQIRPAIQMANMFG